MVHARLRRNYILFSMAGVLLCSCLNHLLWLNCPFPLKICQIHFMYFVFVLLVRMFIFILSSWSLLLLSVWMPLFISSNFFFLNWKSIVFDIIMATLALLWWLFVWYIFFQLICITKLKQVSYKQHIVGPFLNPAW